MVSRAEAKTLAKQAVLREGLLWEEPVHVSRGFFTSSFWTAAHCHGGNVSVRVNRRSGGPRCKA
jgi:hypothetical protein